MLAKHQAEIFVGVQRPRPGDQAMGQFRVDAPIAGLVGVGQGRAPDRLAETHVVELRRLHRQARLDVAQGLPVGQLGEGHRPVLFGAGQSAAPLVPIVPGYDPAEGFPWQEIHDLGEQRLAGVHHYSPWNGPKEDARNSNRGHPLFPRKPAEIKAYRHATLT